MLKLSKKVSFEQKISQKKIHSVVSQLTVEANLQPVTEVSTIMEQSITDVFSPNTAQTTKAKSVIDLKAKVPGLHDRDLNTVQSKENL